MHTEWDNDFALDFLIMYRQEDVIWDPTNVYHKRKDMVTAAWTRISEKINRPVAELKKKKDSLMATFRGHLRRKKATIKAGARGDEIYKPVWFAFDFMEEFLSHCTHAVDDETRMSSEERFRREKISNISFTLSPYNKIEEPSDSEDDTDAVIPKIAASNIGRKRQRCNESQSPADSPERINMDSDIKTRSPSPLPTFIENPLELREPEDDIYGVMHCHRPSTKDERIEDDDCDLYGKILAKKLRKLPDFDRQLLMHEIDGLIINAMREYQKGGAADKSTRPTSSQSTHSM